MKKDRAGKLGTKIVRVVVIMVLLLGLTLVTFSFFSFRKTFRNVYSNKAENSARMIADMIDGDRMGDYAHTLEKDAYYEELEELFSALKRDSGASYLYMFYPEEDSFIYILDAYCEGDGKDTISALGDRYEYKEMEYKYLVPDVQQKKASTELILGQDVGFGTSVSAWAPVLNSDGELVAMVEIDYEMTVVENDMKNYVIFFICFTLAGIAVILLVALIYIRKVLSEPLSDITEIIESFKDGEFRIEGRKIETGDEIQNVYETFVRMVEKIDNYVENITRITAEKGRIETELNVATQIQADMLPNIFPAFPGRKEIDIFATMRPAKEVGGDFYDFFLVDDMHLAFLIADVSGKGVPAALFMVIAKTIIKNHASMGTPVNEVFERTNNQLCEGNKEGFFVTAWLGILNMQTGTLEYANAGHNPPIIMRKDSCEWNDCVPGLVLAAMEDMPYTKYEMQLEPGDRILLYTDGVPESINTETQAYGEERLMDEYEHTRSLTVEEGVRYIQQSVDVFAGEEEQFDDITMLLLEYKGI